MTESKVHFELEPLMLLIWLLICYSYGSRKCVRYKIQFTLGVAITEQQSSSAARCATEFFVLFVSFLCCYSMRVFIKKLRSGSSATDSNFGNRYSRLLLCASNIYRVELAAVQLHVHRRIEYCCDYFASVMCFTAAFW